MPLQNRYAVILAGGRSSRLFPFNKVLSDLTGSGRSLIQQAYDRLVLPRDRIYLLTVKDMVTPIRRQLKLPPSHFFVDPVRRGTWPAILWAMAHLRRRSPDALLAIVTGDHIIQQERAFQKSFREAAGMAERERAIVMMGIPPRQDPQEWRGFGCFRTDAAGQVVAFKEKPTTEQAAEMIREGGWFWNSGMFFFRIGTAEEALALLQPDMHRVYKALAAAVAAGKKDEAAYLYSDFPEKIPHPLDPAHYVDNSIDYAIMTPLVARRGSHLSARAIKGDHFRWTDLGQWDALRQVLKADRHGNIRVGKVLIKEGVRNSILVAEAGCAIAADHVDNLIIAFARGTVLVLTLPNLPRIKEVAQAAFKHPDRLIMEHDVTDCDIRVTGCRLIAIGLSGLSVNLAGRRLVVSAKRGFIR